MTHEFTHEFDDARELMYEELVEMFGEEMVETELGGALDQHLTQIYDQREQIEAQQQQRMG